MNINYIILIIFFLESSNGKHTNHKDGSIGPLGIKAETVAFVNKNLKSHFNAADMHDRDISFNLAKLYIRFFLTRHPEATERDCLLMWRCGWTGRFNPTAEQTLYADHAMRRLELLKEGKDYQK